MISYNPMLYCAAPLCPTLCDPMNWGVPGSSVHGDLPGKNTGVGCYALLQGIFPTLEMNPGLPCCRWILHNNQPLNKFFTSNISSAFFYR